MAKPELLSYVKRVMDLETSVYTNQCLQDGFSSSMAAQAPVHPQKPKQETVSMPSKPTTPTVDEHPVHFMLFMCGVGAALTILGTVCFASGG